MCRRPGCAAVSSSCEQLLLAHQSTAHAGDATHILPCRAGATGGPLKPAAPQAHAGASQPGLLLGKRGLALVEYEDSTDSEPSSAVVDVAVEVTDGNSRPARDSIEPQRTPAFPGAEGEAVSGNKPVGAADAAGVVVRVEARESDAVYAAVAPASQATDDGGSIRQIALADATAAPAATQQDAAAEATEPTLGAPPADPGLVAAALPGVAAPSEAVEAVAVAPATALDGPKSTDDAPTDGEPPAAAATVPAVAVSAADAGAVPSALASEHLPVWLAFLRGTVASSSALSATYVAGPKAVVAAAEAALIAPGALGRVGDATANVTAADESDSDSEVVLSHSNDVPEARPMATATGAAAVRSAAMGRAVQSPAAAGPVAVTAAESFCDIVDIERMLTFGMDGPGETTAENGAAQDVAESRPRRPGRRATVTPRSAAAVEDEWFPTKWATASPRSRTKRDAAKQASRMQTRPRSIGALSLTKVPFLRRVDV